MNIRIGSAFVLAIGLSSCDNPASQSLASETEKTDRSNQVAARSVTPGGALTKLWGLHPGINDFGRYLYLWKVVLGNYDYASYNSPIGAMYSATSSGVNVYLPTGSGYTLCASCSYKYGTIRNGKYSFGDFNGDRLMDFIFQPDDVGGYEVYTSNGNTRGYYSTGFSKAWTGNWPSKGDKITVGDFDGNGRDDLFIQSIGSGWGGYQVHLSTGTTFQYGWKEGWPSWADKVVTGKFTNGYVSDILVTGDRGAGTTWGGWNLRKVGSNNFTEVARGGWPSWGERISVGKVLPEGRDQIIVNANLAYTNWNGFKLMDWNGASFVEKYSASWPSSREIIQIGNLRNNGIGDLFVSPADGSSASNTEWRAYSFPITN